MSEVLVSGLMVAGDADPTFVAWHLSAAESFARIRDEWMATTAQIYPCEIAWLDLTPAGEERAKGILAREAVDDTELLLESIREFLDDHSSAAEFARSFEHLESTNGIRDPAQLRSAFEELANVATCLWEEHLSEGPPPTHVAERGLRSAAQTTYDTAVEIIRQRGLHNTC